MAPISTGLVGWAVAGQPEAAFLSILIVFILSVALLLICTSCKKHTFALEEKVPEQKSSTLVSVSKTGDVGGARENPAVNDTNDEIGDLEISQGGVSFTAWRSHTLTPGSSLHSPVNGTAGLTAQGD